VGERRATAGVHAVACRCMPSALAGGAWPSWGACLCPPGWTWRPAPAQRTAPQRTRSFLAPAQPGRPKRWRQRASGA
jgi:hypothetical protein